MDQDLSKPKGKKVDWNLLESDYIYRSRWYDLREDKIELPSNKEITYTYIEHPGSVFVIPITKDKKIILIRSYRYTVDSWCWEVPAGTLADKNGLSIEDVAHKELAQEIGGSSLHLQYLGWYYFANGFASLKNYFFLAHDISFPYKPQREASEIISHVEYFSPKQVLEMAQNGVINDGESAFAVMLALTNLT